MNTVWIILIAAFPVGYSVVYIAYCFRMKKKGAAVAMSLLSLLAVFACVMLGLIY